MLCYFIYYSIVIYYYFILIKRRIEITINRTAGMTNSFSSRITLEIKNVDGLHESGTQKKIGMYFL